MKIILKPNNDNMTLLQQSFEKIAEGTVDSWLKALAPDLQQELWLQMLSYKETQVVYKEYVDSK